MGLPLETVPYTSIQQMKPHSHCSVRICRVWFRRYPSCSWTYSEIRCVAWRQWWCWWGHGSHEQEFCFIVCSHRSYVLKDSFCKYSERQSPTSRRNSHAKRYRYDVFCCICLDVLTNHLTSFWSWVKAFGSQLRKWWYVMNLWGIMRCVCYPSYDFSLMYSNERVWYFQW